MQWLKNLIIGKARNFSDGRLFQSISLIAFETGGELAANIAKRFPQAVFFGGQLVFPNESWMIRLLHNFMVFALQRQIFRQGLPFLIVPIRV